MDIFTVVIFCVISAVLSLVLRQYRPEYAILVSLACSVLVVVYLLKGIADLGEQLRSVLIGVMIPEELVSVVFKSLGVCILTELAGQVCQDAGEKAIAAKIQLAGKAALLTLSMPLFLRLLETASSLLRMG